MHEQTAGLVSARTLLDTAEGEGEREGRKEERGREGRKGNREVGEMKRWANKSSIRNTEHVLWW